MTTLLCLSGLLCDDTVWQEVADELRDSAEIAVLAFPDFDSITTMAKHALECHSGALALAGHSMGGRVALEMFRLQPERIMGLALLNTGVHPVRAGEAENRQRLVDLANQSGMRALANAWLPPMMGATEDRIAEVLPRLQAMVERSTPASFVAQIRALLTRPDAQAVLARIQVPTLLASGDRDTWSPLAQHELMREQIVGSILEPISNAGHMAPVEQPHAVASALRRWLVRLLV